MDCVTVNKKQRVFYSKKNEMSEDCQQIKENTFAQ